MKIKEIEKEFESKKKIFWIIKISNFVFFIFFLLKKNFSFRQKKVKALLEKIDNYLQKTIRTLITNKIRKNHARAIKVYIFLISSKGSTSLSENYLRTF